MVAKDDVSGNQSVHLAYKNQEPSSKCQSLAPAEA